MSLVPSLDGVTTATATGSGVVSSPAPLSPARRRVARGLGIVGSLVAVAVAWSLGSAAGADYVISDSSGTAAVTLFVAVGFAAQVGLLGWLVLAVLERFAVRARTIWTRAAVTVLLLSEVAIALEGATTETKLALTVLHVVVAAVLVPTFARTSRRS